MAYSKVNWLNRILNNPNKLILKNKTTTEIVEYEIQEDLANVSQEGTSTSAENLNKMDQGIKDLDTKISGATQTEIGYLSGTKSNIQNQLNTGWISLVATLTYSSADAPTFVLTTSIDLINIISVGMKLKLTQTTVKYFIVTAITATTITLYGGTDYTLANATITNVYFSTQKAPFGFPLDTDKWTIVVTDTTNHLITPVANTFYDSGISININIGLWNVMVESVSRTSVTFSSASNINSGLALSSSTPSVADAVTGLDINSTGRYTYNPRLTISKKISLSSKTTYHLYSIHFSGATFNSSDSGIAASWFPTTIIKAVCAYL